MYVRFKDIVPANILKIIVPKQDTPSAGHCLVPWRPPCAQQLLHGLQLPCPVAFSMCWLHLWSGTALAVHVVARACAELVCAMLSRSMAIDWQYCASAVSLQVL